MQFLKNSLNLSFYITAQISLRADGSMKLTDEQLVNEEIIKNRNTFLEKLSIDPQQVVSALLEHDNNVEIVTKENGGQFIPKADGLITSEKGVYLSITVADCLPIVIFHPGKQILCLLHAGWRGLDNKIINKALTTLQNTYNIDTTELLVGIGPAIGPCHYEVNKDVAEKFSHYSNIVIERDSKIFLDLKKVAQNQLTDLGVQSSNIETSDVCTYCQSDTYFSFRKDQTDPVQAMMVVVGIV